jgi:hypothetical protein
MLARPYSGFCLKRFFFTGAVRLLQYNNDGAAQSVHRFFLECANRGGLNHRRRSVDCHGSQEWKHEMFSPGNDVPCCAR